MKGSLSNTQKAGIPQHLRLSTKSLSRCIHLRWKTQICEGVGKEKFTKSGAQTDMIFTEEVTLKKFYLKPFAKKIFEEATGEISRRFDSNPKKREKKLRKNPIEMYFVAGCQPQQTAAHQA